MYVYVCVSAGGVLCRPRKETPRDHRAIAARTIRTMMVGAMIILMMVVHYYHRCLQLAAVDNSRMSIVFVKWLGGGDKTIDGRGEIDVIAVVKQMFTCLLFVRLCL